MTFVDRPWKMYPVGVLFGFGFDTASSIGLLAITAIAKRDADGKHIPSGYVVILPFLFTAGMTLIDSLDSVLMLYSYSGFPEHGWSLFVHQDESKIGKQPVNVERNEGTLPITRSESLPAPVTRDVDPNLNADDITVKSRQNDEDESRPVLEPVLVGKTGDERILRVKQNVMSGLSIVLTLMSIFVAFAISLITIMALIGEHCRPCRKAAEADEGRGGGLAGKWWRGWARANDNSGFIGAAIVGAFLFVVITWHGAWWGMKKYKGRSGN